MEVGEDYEKTGTKPTSVMNRKERKDGEEGRKVQERRRAILNIHRRGSKRKKAVSLTNFRRYSMKDVGWCRRLRKPRSPLS